MKPSFKFLLNTSTLLITASILQNAHAGIDDLYSDFANPVETEAAKALLATYNGLRFSCENPDSIYSTCTPSQSALYVNLRAIVHTANQITFNRGQSEEDFQFSLIGNIIEREPNGNYTEDFFIGELGKFLRWNAGEEYAAQGSMSRDFIHGQTSGLAARLSTLRMGSAFGNTNSSYNTYALANGMSGGGAGDTDSYSRWSGFLNYTQGSGDKEATDLEDAFDVDSGEITGGIDYRIDNNWVAGVILGYTDQDLDFNSVGNIVVEGGVASDGYSVLPFMMYQDDSFYLSFSGGYQALSFDSRRAISYGYDILDADTASSTDSVTTTLGTELGYTFQQGGFALEPYYKNQFASSRIDAFTERDLTNSGLNLAVEEQRFSSTTHAIGLKAQYTFSTDFGVIIPYTSYQFNNDRHTGNTTIAARYANSGSTDTTFVLSKDKNDENYGVFNIGVSSVIRGSRQTEADGVSSGGIQVFLSYKAIKNLENYDFNSYALGIRYEF